MWLHLMVLLSEYEKASYGLGKWGKLATFLHQSLEGPVSDLAKRQIYRLGAEKSSDAISSLEVRSSSQLKTLDSANLESSDWKRKYEIVLSKQKTEEEHATAEIAVLKSRTSAAEARLAAVWEQAQSAQDEAEEWNRKYDIAVREAKAALEKAAVEQERSNKKMQEGRYSQS
ncbi:hypothetical protein Ancab_033889 [Ancistrocladus abbreviatus]